MYLLDIYGLRWYVCIGEFVIFGMVAEEIVELLHLASSLRGIEFNSSPAFRSLPIVRQISGLIAYSMEFVHDSRSARRWWMILLR